MFHNSQTKMIIVQCYLCNLTGDNDEIGITLHHDYHKCIHLYKHSVFACKLSI